MQVCNVVQKNSLCTPVFVCLIKMWHIIKENKLHLVDYVEYNVPYKLCKRIEAP